MIGYLVNARWGAALYNFFHHKAVAVCCFGVGWQGVEPWLVATGAILFAHSSFDRVFGYGLKYNTGFAFTHLGEIGKKKKE